MDCLTRVGKIVVCETTTVAGASVVVVDILADAVNCGILKQEQTLESFAPINGFSSIGVGTVRFSLPSFLFAAARRIVVVMVVVLCKLVKN